MIGNSIVRSAKFVRKSQIDKNKRSEEYLRTIYALNRIVDQKVWKKTMYGFTKIDTYSIHEQKMQYQNQIYLKLKGKFLMSLKQYPKNSLKKALWKWHLTSSSKGQKLLSSVADSLVLYTNINKATAFYRLMKKAKQIQPYKQNIVRKLFWDSSIKKQISWSNGKQQIQSKNQKNLSIKKIVNITPDKTIEENYYVKEQFQSDIKITFKVSEFKTQSFQSNEQSIDNSIKQSKIDFFTIFLMVLIIIMVIPFDITGQIFYVLENRKL